MAAVLVAGCGSDGPGGDPRVYREDGEAICADYEAAIAKLPQPLQLRDIGTYIERATPILQRTVARIERLDPPNDLREEFEEFRGVAAETLDRARRLREAARRADSAEVERLLEEAREATARRVELARAAGLQTCADL